MPRDNLLLDAIKRLNLEIEAELAVIPQRPAPDQLLDTKHLAGLLMVSERTLEAWRADGRGPRVTRVGGAVRYRYSDVLAFIAAQNGGPEAKGPGT